MGDCAFGGGKSLTLLLDEIIFCARKNNISDYYYSNPKRHYLDRDVFGKENGQALTALLI